MGLIDYNMGNLLSVRRALEAAGAGVFICRAPEDFERADGILLPGVGNFGDGARQLRELGFAGPVGDWCRADRPFLGICLGMQLLFDGGEEAPEEAGLGIIPGRVPRFPAGVEKVPHMGWNRVRHLRPSPLTAGIADGEYFYFVHSYHVRPGDPAWTVAECDYITPFAAAVGQGRIAATQFHPEKSQDAGRRILENFIAMTERP